MSVYHILKEAQFPENLFLHPYIPYVTYNMGTIYVR